jgi:hypothetical protein
MLNLLFLLLLSCCCCSCCTDRGLGLLLLLLPFFIPLRTLVKHYSLCLSTICTPVIGRKRTKRLSRAPFLLRTKSIRSTTHVWLDRATIQFRFFGPSSFNTALQLVLRPHFLVHFV